VLPLARSGVASLFVSYGSLCHSEGLSSSFCYILPWSVFRPFYTAGNSELHNALFRYYSFYGSTVQGSFIRDFVGCSYKLRIMYDRSLNTRPMARVRGCNFKGNCFKKYNVMINFNVMIPPVDLLEFAYPIRDYKVSRDIVRKKKRKQN